MPSVSDNQINSLASGVATAMNNLQTRIEDRILAETFPIAGNRLAGEAAAGRGALTATEQLGATLQTALTALSALPAVQTDTDVVTALQNALNGAGFTGVLVDLNVVGGEVRITLGATHTESYIQSLNGDLGFGNLNLEGEGTARVAASFAYDLRFGTDASNAFFLNAGELGEVSLGLDVDQLSLVGDVLIDGQEFDATDAGSLFSGDILINIGGSGRISAADIATATVNGQMNGGADMAIDVGLTQGGEFVPALSAIFDIDWDFVNSNVNPDNANTGFGSPPVVVFRDVTMDLGGFMERFVAPLVNQLDALLEPLKPIANILTTNIRLLSSFPVVGSKFDADDDGKVTIVDLVKLVVPSLDTAPILALAELIKDVGDWVDLLDGLGFGTGDLNLGDFAILNDFRAAGFDLTQAAPDFVEGSESALSSVISGLGGAGWNTGGRDLLEDLTGSDIFSLPVLDDPSQWMNLLLGGDADLVGIDLPEISLGTGGSKTLLGPIPLFFGINLNVTGAVDLTVDLDFGFNTRGLTDPTLSPIDGFFIVDGAGPEVELDSSVGLVVSLNAGIVGLEGGGDVRGEIDMELINGATSGRLYYDEFIAALQGNPFSIFTGKGEINLGFSAVLDSIFGEVWRWDSPRITLGSFSFGGSNDNADWNLGAKSGGTLTLNVGSLAGNRADLANRLDNAERMELSLAPDGTLKVIHIGGAVATAVREQTFTNITHVIADGGNFDDELVLAEGLLVTTSLRGGVGNDILGGGDSRDTLFGDADNDVLFGYEGNDSLFGGLGNDFLNGGQGADTLFGDGGTDRISYADSAAAVSINLSTNVVSGGDAQGDVISSIESVEGTAFNDTIIGSVGTGSFFGFAGDDTLSSGTLAMLLSGGDGNDRLVANGAGHTLVGGMGNDTYVVFNATTTLAENLLNEITGTGGVDTVEAWVNFALTANDTLIENITLFNTATTATGNSAANVITGNVLNNSLYGGSGNDTLFGGTGNDVLNGSAGNDALYGDVGNDVLDGGTGNDVYFGGEGADFYAVDTGDVIVDSSSNGVDFVHARSDYALVLGQRLEILSVISVLGQDWASAYQAADRITALKDLIDDHGIAPKEGGNVNLTGGSRDDVLIGYGAGTSTLAGLGGADTLIGDAGDTASYAASDVAVDISLARATQQGGHAAGDIIDGIRRVVGSAFGDVITAGIGVNVVRDTFLGGAGNDTLSGRGGIDKLFGGAGDDTLDGGTGNDTMYGGDGKDNLDGSSGEDTMYGGRGDDTYIIDSLGDSVSEIGGAATDVDTISTSVSFRLGTATSVEVLRAATLLTAAVAIDLTGNVLNQTLIGHDGANSLTGGGGNDTMQGGLGNDVYVVDGGDTVLEAAFAGYDQVRSSATHTLSRYVEDLILTGSAAADGTGNNGNNRITGNLGVNTLAGLRGADTLTGTNEDTVSYAASDRAVDINLFRATQEGGHAAGDIINGIDRIISSAFDDVINTGGVPQTKSRETFYGGDGNDRLTGLSGIDKLYGDNGNDTLYGGNEDDSLYGGAGRDSLFGGAGNDNLFGGLGQSTLTGGDGNDTLDGNSLADTLYGGDGKDTLKGGDGADVLDGGLGADLMYGDAGNDTYIVRDAANRVEEISGLAGEVDTVEAAISFTLQPLVNVEILRTIDDDATTVLNLTGNGLNQTIIGNAGANSLNGGGGNDTLQGGRGNDVYVIDAGDVVIEAGAFAGTDTVRSNLGQTLAANVEKLVLTGNLNVHGTGNGLDNTLTGNSADNRLNGAAGADVLTGKGGDDVFVFAHAVSVNGPDQITDFNVADDQIELDNAIFTGLLLGTLSSIRFVANTSGQAINSLHRIIYDTDDGGLYYDADGSGAGARQLFAELDAGLSLRAGDLNIV